MEKKNSPKIVEVTEDVIMFLYEQHKKECRHDKILFSFLIGISVVSAVLVYFFA